MVLVGVLVIAVSKTKVRGLIEVVEVIKGVDTAMCVGVLVIAVSKTKVRGLIEVVEVIKGVVTAMLIGMVVGVCTVVSAEVGDGSNAVAAGVEIGDTVVVEVDENMSLYTGWEAGATANSRAGVVVWVEAGVTVSSAGTLVGNRAWVVF